MLIIFIMLVLVHEALILCWRLKYSSDDMQYNASIINNGDTLPNNFINVWDKLYPNSRTISMNREIWHQLLRRKGKYLNSYCDDIGYIARSNNHCKLKWNCQLSSFMDIYFGYGLQYYSTPERCFDFWMNNSVYKWHDAQLYSLNDLALLKFQKNITNMTDDEILQLLAYHSMGPNHSRDILLYNKRLEDLREKINK